MGNLIRAGLAAFIVLAGPAPAAEAPRIAMESYPLANGMRIILAPDHAVPVTTLSIIYDVGGRHEHPGRSGFAHLFEHLMFVGSAHVPKGDFDRLLESYGGDNNAETHQDYTIYYEEMPSNALPIALWLEADRLSALKITKETRENQISVVKEEKRIRIDNEPYGSALNDEISARSFKNWQNSHSSMGSFKDLEAVSSKDVRNFFNDYYAPSNAVLAVVGDFEPAQVMAWIQGYFGWIPNRGKVVPVDTKEPAGFSFSSSTLNDVHANLPAVILTWKGLPQRRASPDFYALALLSQILFNGKSSRLYLSLVKDKQVAVSVDGGLGFPEADFSDFKAPWLFTAFVIYKEGKTAAQIQSLIEEAVSDIARNGVSQEELDRIKTKFRSNWIRSSQTALGRAQTLLKAALLDGDPEIVNGELDRYMAVKAAEVQDAAAKYFQRDRQMLLDVKPGAKPMPMP